MHISKELVVAIEGNFGMKDFNERIDEKRKHLFNPNFPTEYKQNCDTIDDIQELKNGEYCTNVSGVEFKFLLQKKNSDYLYVFLNGAAGFESDEKSKYRRWSWGNLVDANILNILDPMYFKYDNLPIGWYYGEKNLDYRQLMAELIKKIADKLGVVHSKIVLYGSSAGGTAALYSAHYIPGCTVVALNPQVRLWKHEWHEEFKKIVGIDSEDEDVFHRNDIAWHIDNSKDCKFMFIVNCRSRRDFNWQLIPLAQRYNFVVNYGLNNYNNIYTWVFDTGIVDKHTALEYPAVFISIDNIVRKINKGCSMSELNDMVLLTNEFWRDHWELMNGKDKQ